MLSYNNFASGLIAFFEQDYSDLRITYTPATLSSLESVFYYFFTKMYFRSTVFVASILFASNLAATSNVAGNYRLLALDTRTTPETPKKQTTTPGMPSVGQKGPFKIDDYLNDWLGEAATKQAIYYADLTDGGWEGWAQFEFEVYVRRELKYDYNKRVREIQIYDGSSQAADFTFENSDQLNNNGMVVELKCENKNSLAGTKAATAFEQDIKKLEGKLKQQYHDMSKVAIVMAYSKEAQSKLEAMQNKNVISISIPEVPVGDSGLKLKVYRWDPDESDSTSIEDDMSKLGFSDPKCKRGTLACPNNTDSSSAVYTSRTSSPTAATSKTPSFFTTISTLPSSATKASKTSSSERQSQTPLATATTSKTSSSPKEIKTTLATAKTSKTSKAPYTAKKLP